MTLRCKAGDLARVINSGPLRDRFVVVTHCSDMGWGPEWFYEGPELTLPNGDKQLTFYDWVLEPIRRPGDDAIDEISTRRPTALPAATVLSESSGEAAWLAYWRAVEEMRGVA